MPKTIADGLQTTAPGELTFAIAREHVCTVVTVSDDELRDADALCLRTDEARDRAERRGRRSPRCCSGRIPEHRRKARRDAIVSGGNIDPARYADLLR